MSLTYREIVTSVPKSEPYSFTFEVDGKNITVCWINRFPCANREDVKNVASEEGCKECTSRAFKLVMDEGENGPMFFPSMISPKTTCFPSSHGQGSNVMKN